MKMVKIKLKDGIKHYADALLSISEGEIVDMPEGWRLTQLLGTGNFEIVKEPSKKPKKKEGEN